MIEIQVLSGLALGTMIPILDDGPLKIQFSLPEEILIFMVTA
jgi:hypothetical protein